MSASPWPQSPEALSKTPAKELQCPELLILLQPRKFVVASRERLISVLTSISGILSDDGYFMVRLIVGQPETAGPIHNG
jgi:hypothetical protein